MGKKYSLRQEIAREIKDNLKYFSPLEQELLFWRNIKDEKEAVDFLNPDFEKHTHDPYLLMDMQKTVERIISSIEGGEKIAIYSDYDADGIPGAVVLNDFFERIGYKNIIYYIPMRNEEGFGLNDEAIDSLVSQGVKLLITIDCGTTNIEEVTNAERHGLDIIITDHHIPKEKLPPAFAIVNPKRKDCPYPEKMLCGAGVIFKVVQALIKHPKINFPKGQEKWSLDMVGLATLSDMVPLFGENRVFAYFGMKVLRKSPRPGLTKLFSKLKIDQRYTTEDDISFMITPRINAASRMGVPLDAFKLLSTKDEIEAGTLVEHLNDKNDERKGMVGSMIKEIKKKISERDEEMKKVLVLGNPEWKPSLLGLVANSFSDEHNRPVFLWGREGKIIKGSCRSGGETNVVVLMEKVKEIFIEYGGHSGAGGFSLSQEQIYTLEDKLNEAFMELQKDSENILDQVEMMIDKKISLAEINWDTYGTIEKFAPFGLENPKPSFLIENIKVNSVKQFGKEKNHLEIKVGDDRKEITAISFFNNPTNFSVPIDVGNKINLVANLEKSNFRNFPELRLRVIDIF